MGAGSWNRTRFSQSQGWRQRRKTRRRVPVLPGAGLWMTFAHHTGAPNAWWEFLVVRATVGHESGNLVLKDQEGHSSGFGPQDQPEAWWRQDLDNSHKSYRNRRKTWLWHILQENNRWGLLNSGVAKENTEIEHCECSNKGDRGRLADLGGEIIFLCF